MDIPYFLAFISHLYQADVNPDEDYLDTFTKYVIRQWTHILQLERDHILEGMFSWYVITSSMMHRNMRYYRIYTNVLL